MLVFSPEALMIVRVAVGKSLQPQDIPSHTPLAWCDAIVSALTLARSFDSGGALRAQRALARVHVRKTVLCNFTQDARLLRARKDAMHLKAAVNLLLGPHLCFASSFALCAGLRRLGFPCHVAVGYEQIQQYTETPMDAYVIYENEPVSTTPEVKYSFLIMLTYGQGENQ